MKKLFIILFLLTSISSKAQSDEELTFMLARICKIDEIDKTMSYIDEKDSIKKFNFLTLNYEEMGAPVFEFEDFSIVYDVGSNLLMSEKPYGKISIDNFSSKKAQLTITLAGAGDRSKMGLWTKCVFEFKKPKNGKWLLANTEFVKE
jgi:hypothetical protein